MCYRVVVRQCAESQLLQWGRIHNRLGFKGNDHLYWMEWGCLKRESTGLPVGPSMHLNDLMGGELDAFFPRFVPLCIESFWVERCQHIGSWYHVHPQNYVQGVILSAGIERLYIVMMEPNRRLTDVQSWPVILRRD